MSFEIIAFNKVNELVNLEGFPFVCNSEHSKLLLHKIIDELYVKHKYVTWPQPRIGRDRSLDQNSLAHVWLTECAAYYLSKHKKDVTPSELEGMKRAAKAKFYVEHKQPWMIHEIANPWTGAKKKDYTSTKSWSRGEMTMFLEWLQRTAANDGLILEAVGEFEKLQRETNK